MTKKKNTEPFPAAQGDGCEPFRTIGAKLGVSEFDVLDAFAGLPVPEWSTSQQIEVQRESARLLGQAAIRGERF
jgi:hypothetical protein